MYSILRLPFHKKEHSIPEHISLCITKEEADRLIEKYCRTGYFKKEDFIIKEVKIEELTVERW